ncbi:hypothetical protein HMPREF0542_11815 [Ligilactobacillus ruminis ATCC 25644]|uniref:Uncharacterized protein n=1 Tax=Ligilactobacillus ruminis ATCC 25644 TaxID=525362 RepID=E7FSD8_9LACO|nr:hypothetical protein HMPREF0542_11815 [Ligilactobacillus ruminis ATCC 25644]
MADHDYGQNGRFLKFARKWQTLITGKTGVFWNLPVNDNPSTPFGLPYTKSPDEIRS